MKCGKSLYSIYNKKTTKKHYWMCDGIKFENKIDAIRYATKHNKTFVEFVR